MGEVIATAIDLDVEALDSSSSERVPGLGWTLSEETEQSIREIDASIRAAEQMTGSLLLG